MNVPTFESGRRLDEAEEVVERLAGMALPLAGPDDLDPLIDRVGDARYVLLGEASHGTSEYYLARAHLTRRLIADKGFSFVAVAGDWPDGYRLNRFVKGYANAGASAEEVLHCFRRWPDWIWANRELAALIEWLRSHNEGLDESAKVGFYGLDAYSFWQSLATIMDFLDRREPAVAAMARRAHRWFPRYGEDMQATGAVAFIPAASQPEVVDLLVEQRRDTPLYCRDGRDAVLQTEQSALAERDGKRYYRAMLRGGATSWNVRERHMTETVERLMRYHGAKAKCVIWEHNGHVGDARAMEMAEAGVVTMGQLLRQSHYAADVALVGCGSYCGSVVASRNWGAAMERLSMPPAPEGSWTDLLHRAGPANKMLLFDHGTTGLRQPRDARAIGVVYDPADDRSGDYSPTHLPRRYNAFLYFDVTHALHPLDLEPLGSAGTTEMGHWWL